MKKQLLLFILVTASTMIAAEEFQIIKGKYHYATNVKYDGKIKYDGFVDENGKPYIFGRVSAGENDFAVGLVKNGIIDGWTTIVIPFMNDAETSYIGIAKWNYSTHKCEPSGYGKSIYDFTPYDKKYIIADETTYDKGGLAILDGDKKSNYTYTYIKKGTKYSPYDVYKQSLYDNQKQYIKQECTKRNVRYMEDVDMGRYYYSGGWKDGMPYYYGAYYTTWPSYSVYLGMFTCSKQKNGEYTFVRNGNVQHYNGDNYAFYTLKVVGSDSVITAFSGFSYQKFTINKDNEFTSYTQMTFNENNSYAEIIKAKSQTEKSQYWGIYYEKDGNNPTIASHSLYEGYLNIDRNGHIYPTGIGVTIRDDGEITHHLNEEEHETYSYPDGTQFECYKENASRKYPVTVLFSRGIFPGIYTLANKNYVIGYFSRHVEKNMQDQLFHNFSIEYGEEYDSNNHLVKTYMSNPNWDTKEYNDVIALMRNDYCRPTSGIARYTFINGDVYDGEWKDKKKMGREN